MLGIPEHQAHLGTVICAFHRAAHRRIPRLKRIKSSVDLGNCLTDWQIEYLELVIKDTHNLASEFDDYPEIQGIYTRIVKLYHDITERALMNERLAQKGVLH